MATYYRRIDRDIQVSEATTVKRQIAYEVGTAEAQTVTVRKAGGSFGASSSTAAAIAGVLYELTITAADLSAEGELVFKSEGATDTQYVYGLRVVDHDPFDDIAAILADTGTDGVALAADAITAAKIADDAFAAEHFANAAIGTAVFQNDINFVPQEIEASEATTARRTLYYRVGTAEAQTVTVSKAGGAFGASSSAASQADGTLYKLVIVPADLDTLGALAFKSCGSTNTQYITGLQVVNHDPYGDLKTIRQAVAGTVVTDTSDNTIKIKDTDGATTLVTRTKTTDGTETTWTAS
jgi:hypothetical protein